MYSTTIRNEKIDALVFSRRAVGESDRLVTLFTRNQGIIRAFAKGVRKIPSRRGGHMESMTRVFGIVSGSKGNLYLSSIETSDYYRQLHYDFDALERASFLRQVVVGLFEEQEVMKDIFDLLVMSWENLPLLSLVKRSLLEMAVLWRIINKAGYLPQLKSCQICGLSTPKSIASLRVEQGGWNCVSCDASGTGIKLDAMTLVVIRYISVHPEKAMQIKVKEDDARRFESVLRSYCLELVGPIKSLIFDGAK